MSNLSHQITARTMNPECMQNDSIPSQRKISASDNNNNGTSTSASNSNRGRIYTQNNRNNKHAGTYSSRSFPGANRDGNHKINRGICNDTHKNKSRHGSVDSQNSSARSSSADAIQSGSESERTCGDGISQCDKNGSLEVENATNTKQFGYPATGSARKESQDTHFVPFNQFVHSTTEDLLNGNFNVQVLKNVGSGFAGSVYKCLVTEKSGNETEGRVSVVAFKILPKERTHARVATTEVSLLHLGRHSNILQLIMSIESLDAYWIITEYCSRGDLHSRLHRLDDSNVIAREYLIDVIAGLEYLHDKLIVHADIKMKNILISERNNAKLGDFGFAKQYCSEDDRETVCHGTRDYWAPEMFRDCPSYNPFMADVYALAVTFVGVCEKRPIKLKYDVIHHIVSDFKDQHQVSLFRGMLSGEKQRWGLNKIKSNLWLNECVSPPHTPA